jgi:hypothetical protein
MNMIQMISVIFFLFATVCTAVPIPRQDRINHPDPDTQNMINEHLGTVKLFTMHSGGGGWPSTTGNPSGGGRWNNED